MEVKELVALLSRFDDDMEVVLLTASGTVKVVDDAFIVEIHGDKRELLPKGSRLSSDERASLEKVVALETE